MVRVRRELDSTGDLHDFLAGRGFIPKPSCTSNPDTGNVAIGATDIVRVGDTTAPHRYRIDLRMTIDGAAPADALSVARFEQVSCHVRGAAKIVSGPKSNEVVITRAELVTLYERYLAEARDAA